MTTGLQLKFFLLVVAVFELNLAGSFLIFSKGCSNGDSSHSSSKSLPRAPLGCSSVSTSRSRPPLFGCSATKMPVDTFSESDTISDTLLGLVGCISNQIPSSSLIDALEVLETLSPSSSEAEKRPDDSSSQKSANSNIERQFSQAALAAAQELCRVATDPTLKKKQSWQTLQQTAGRLQEASTESNALAIAFVFGALSLMKEDTAKAAASAISSTVSRNKPFRHVGRNVANHVLRAFLVHASHSDALKLNIIAHLAKAFKLTEEEEHHHAELVATVIRYSLGLTLDGPNRSTSEDQKEEDYEVQKQRVSGALALACQVHPWPVLSPLVLVNAAIPYDFWQVAEQVCGSAYKSASVDNESATDATGEDSTALTEAIAAVEFLVDTAMDDKTYRRADNIASNLYKEGGKYRYVEARFYHACDTIARVVYKRQIPIIERQVDRVYRAVAKANDTLTSFTEDPSREIRVFAMGQLEEAGEIDAAHRLATLWGMDYVYDEEAMLEAAAARRRRYTQFEDVLPGIVPDLVSDPQELRRAFEHFRQSPYQHGPFGLDAEWGEDGKGADLLQLANPKLALLIDIPALSSTADGVSALKETVGALFDCADSVVVGFACRQDLSRLRASPCVKKEHWLAGSSAIVDAQQLVGEDEPKLKKLGLSRACEHYFGKPLDKAEQCSFWATRPLSEKQRAYAALDAWVCAGVYEKLFPSMAVEK
jgi:hypothetical protein